MDSVSAAAMQNPHKRKRNDDMSKHTFVFRRCAEAGPASVDIQLIETLKDQIERLKVDTETMGRRLEHLERKDEISSARLLMLESKSGISYRFRSSARQKDDVHVCCAAGCGFRSQKSTKLHSHWKASSSPEHQLMASLWNSRYCYPCSKWFDSTKAFYSHEAKHGISASPRPVDLDLRKILGNGVDVDGPVQECGSVSSGNSLPVTTPVGHSLSSDHDLQYAGELGGGDRHTPAHTQNPTTSQLSAPEQRDSNFHSQTTQPPLSALADANGEECLPVQLMCQSGNDWRQDTQASSCPASGNANTQGEEYPPAQPIWQSDGDWPIQDTQASSCPASGNANTQGEEYPLAQLIWQSDDYWPIQDTQASCPASGTANTQGEEYPPAQPIWQSDDGWPIQNTQASSCPASGNANTQGEEYPPAQPIWQSDGNWPIQNTQASSCPASGNANSQGKGAYSIQATLQGIADWPTQASSYPASKDANHQGQSSHAPFQEKEYLTPQLGQLRQRPANASRAKATTNTSDGAAMQCVGCNHYQALMSIVTQFLHTRGVRCQDRVDGEGSFVSVVADTAG
jgi:hypothetical protein